MNRYDEYFDFRMADRDDIDAIMRFIKKHWNPKHILANDREFFEYHFGGLDGGINIFLMCEKTGKIAGMIGFVQYSNEKVKYISTFNTKVREDLPIPMSGIELMKRYREYMNPFVEFSCGTNTKTILPIFKRVFHYYTGVLSQYYLLNEKMRDFKIITVPERKHRETECLLDRQCEMMRLKTIEDITFDWEGNYPRLPVKEKAFWEKRYFHHPIFQYDIYGIKDDLGYKGVIFTRKVHHNGACMIFVVDFVGDINCLGKIRSSLLRILEEEYAECFSFLEAGMPQGILECSGFQKIDLDKSDVIIPTYFEPFANCNVVNYWITNEKNLIIFKGSGDQDNPKYAK